MVGDRIGLRVTDGRLRVWVNGRQVARPALCHPSLHHLEPDVFTEGLPPTARFAVEMFGTAGGNSVRVVDGAPDPLTGAPCSPIESDSDVCIPAAIGTGPFASVAEVHRRGPLFSSAEIVALSQRRAALHQIPQDASNASTLSAAQPAATAAPTPRASSNRSGLRLFKPLRQKRGDAGAAGAAAARGKAAPQPQAAAAPVGPARAEPTE